MNSYQVFKHVGLAVDPIHVGAGGARIGRVELAIMREPATQLPKIPGSSLSGVYRTYVAMSRQRYPNCAGLGQPRDGREGHCGQPDCPICTVFGFARGKDQAGGFAGLAAFSDAHILLFPVATRQGPLWITCPIALRLIGWEVEDMDKNVIYRDTDDVPLSLGWLLLPVKKNNRFDQIKQALQDLNIPGYVLDRLAILRDDLFIHVVNSNLEVRTSVSIDPETGAAEERALFSYEALPRTTILYWEIICKNPAHFRVGGQPVAFGGEGQSVSINDVYDVVQSAHPYLEHLGIGGMGTRGMGRLKVLYSKAATP